MNCADFRRTGSAALDLCYVACGRQHAYLEQNQQDVFLCPETIQPYFKHTDLQSIPLETDQAIFSVCFVTRKGIALPRSISLFEEFYVDLFKRTVNLKNAEYWIYFNIYKSIKVYLRKLKSLFQYLFHQFRSHMNSVLRRCF